MKSLTILLALFVLIGCQNGKKNNNPDERLQEKEVPDNFDIGEAKDGRYTNNYFNLSFEYDQEWDVLTYEELESLMDMGVEVSSQSNKKLKKSFEAAKVRTAQHFGAFKHDPETFTGMFNPSVLVLSENVTMHDMQYGDEYLEKIRDTWSKTNMGIKQDGAIEEEKIECLIDLEYSHRNYDICDIITCDDIKDYYNIKKKICPTWFKKIDECECSNCQLLCDGFG